MAAGNIHLIINSAIQQLQEAIDRAVKLQSSLVQLGDPCSESRALSEEVLHRCRTVISLLTSAGGGSCTAPDRNASQEREPRVEFGPPSSTSTDVSVAGREPQAAGAALLGGTEEEGDHDHQLANCAWEFITDTPYIDGHEWRKYGEKKISGYNFTRSYYRCTYSKERRCKAKKQVQQQKHGFPSLYLVTYQGDHTCRDDDDDEEGAGEELQGQLRKLRSLVPSNYHGEGRRHMICNAAASSQLAVSTHRQPEAGWSVIRHSPTAKGDILRRASFKM